MSKSEDRSRGVVTQFLVRKGYGFIKIEGGEEVFVHFSSIRGEGFKSLEIGEDVEFTLATGERGNFAADVIRLNPPPPKERDSGSSEPGRTW